MRTILAVFALFGSGLVVGSDSELRRCGSIESDLQRLECFDALVPKAAPEVPADPLRESIDRMLASTLIDPLSALDYSVSGTLSCKSISRFWPKDDSQCVCYSVNAKNRMGGYTGSKLSFAVVTPLEKMFLALAAQEVDTAEGVRACAAAGMENRSASLIGAAVKR